MKTPCIPIDIISIYKNNIGDPLPLPRRMALCTPDTFLAITALALELQKRNGKLVLSDLFRSYDMQAQSYHDFVTGKKKAYSPPPGGSFHEAGRGFDLDLAALGIPLSDFWKLAAKYGVVPIISQPKTSVSEAWHFDCRGSHQLVYNYYAAGKADNMKPYTAAAASAILAIGVRVDQFAENQKQALIQSYLVRLGNQIGNIDGLIGRKTQKAIEELNLRFSSDLDETALQLENLLQKKFPAEFTLSSASGVRT